MEFLKTRHEQKSFLITIFMVILLLFLFSFIGLKYIDPPIEYGMEVNLGSNDTGKGLKSTNEEVLDPETNKLNISKEDINLEKPAISKTTPSKVVTQKNTEVKKPKVSDVTKSIISNLINIESKSEITQGEGETQGFSDQGKSKGDPYSTMYYGQEGRGGQGVGYGLSGRSLQVNGKETQDCNESGTVVVRIVVNKLGEVVSAKPGVKGTTNNDPCLLKPAKNTALMHRWFPDANAPEKQIGFVVIEFKLVE